MALMDRLRRAKADLIAAHSAHPDCPHMKRVHDRALSLLYRLAPELGLSDAERDELAMPQGGGTPKTPPPDEGGE